MSAFGTKRTYRDDLLLVRFRGEADMHDGVALTPRSRLTLVV
jgi:hypothetical protein